MEDFQGGENSLYDTKTIDTYPYTLAQTHGMYNIKSEPSSKLWILGD